MNLEFTPYVFPLLAAAAVSIFVAVYAWRHLAASGAGALLLMAVAIAEWCIGYALEISSTDLDTMYIWGVSQYIGIAFAPYAWLVFAIDFSGNKKILTRRFLLGTAIFPIITIIIALTTKWNGLIWTEYYINRQQDFSAIGVSHGIWFFIHTAYSYLLLLAGTILLARILWRRRGLYRGQVVAMLVAVLAPWVGNVLYLTGNSPIPYLDITPFSFSVTVAAVAWAIFGFHLVDITPIARDQVVDSLQEGVLVLDGRGRVADINVSAARIFGVEIGQIIGTSADEVFVPWPQLMGRIRDLTDWVEQFSTGTGQAQRHYEAALSRIHDSEGRAVGRVMIIREVGAESVRRIAPSIVRVLEGERPASEEVKTEERGTQRRNPLFGWLLDFLIAPVKEDLPIPANVNPVWYRARERAFTIIMRVGALVGTIAFVFTIPLQNSETVYGPANFVLGLSILILWLLGAARNYGFQTRANIFLFLIYVMAVNETISFGFSVESFLFFTAFVIISTLLAGRSGVRASIGISFLTLIGFALLIGSKWFLPLNVAPELVRPATIGTGLTNVFVFMAVSLATSNATVVLMENLNSAWQREAQALNLLQQERNLLEQRVEERTRELSEAEVKFRTLVEQLPAVLYRDDADSKGANNYFSPQIEAMLGYSMSEWASDRKFWHSILHPDDFERATTSIDETLKSGRSASEYRILSKDGRTVWVRDEALLVRDRDGNPQFVQGFMQDITEFKRAEEQIRKLSQAVEQSGNSIVITNTNGDIEYVNPKFEKVTGYSLEEVRGKNSRILKSGNQRLEFYEKLWGTITSGQAWTGVFHNRRKDGSLYWEAATIAPVLDDNGIITNYVAIKEDITPRRQAEEELRKLSQAVEQSANTIIIMDRDGLIEYANPTFTAVTGYSLKEALGSAPGQLMNPGIEDFRETEWWRTVISGNIWRGEFRNHRKDGTMFWESASISPVFDPNGAITNFIEIKQDITNQKLLQDQLQKQNDYLSILHQVTLDMLDRRDLDDLLQVIVDRSSILLDAPYSELMLEEDDFLVVKAFTKNQPNLMGDKAARGQALLSWQAFDSHEPVLLDDYATWEHRRDVYTEKQIHATADFPVMAGERCLGVLALGRDEPGYTFTPEQVQTGILFARLVALVIDSANLYESAIREISERKRAQALLEESEIRFRQIVENASDIIYRTDINGRFTYANPAALNMMGFKSEEEVLGRNYLELTTPESRQRLKRTYDRQFLGRIKNTYYEFPAITVTGETVWVGQNVQLIMDGETIVGFQALARNITQLRQAQEALLLARDQALEASRFKSQLVSRVSHELRTPLGGILGYAELLQHKAFGPLTERQYEAITNIVESTHFLTNTVNDLLDQAQIESRSIILHQTYFNPKTLLDRISNNMSLLARKKGLEFQTGISPDLPTELYGDENRLYQVIVNLAGNAIKFTSAGGVRVSLTRPSPAQWSIQVNDTGVGIPEEERANIFEPFRQISNAITRENRGSGLGLAIVKQLVDLMNGQITLESQPGKGSAFTITLPFVQTSGE